MPKYLRVMLGKGSAHVAECLAGGFIGADFGVNEDLASRLTDDWRAFNETMIPVYLSTHPGKSKIAAGLACGALWTVCKGIEIGDVVLSPDGQGQYLVGDVTGGYSFVPGATLPHRRAVRWRSARVTRASMSDALRHSTGSIGTVSDISGYAQELEALCASESALPSSEVPEIPADQGVFALEKHLEEFLVENWASTALGREFDIYEEDGELVGQQYPTDTGPLDILAISKDRRRLLVVELKRGRPSDAVVGQTLRYMGFIQDERAEPGQVVEGAIIALEDDPRIRRALRMTARISFYRYEVSFKLNKVELPN